MKRTHIRSTVVICLVIVFAFIQRAFCIDIDTSRIEKHSFKKEEWKKVTSGIDYSKETKPRPPSKFKPFKGLRLTISPVAGKVILFTLIISLLIYILILVFVGNLLFKNIKVKAGNEFTEENHEEDIHSNDLEKLYREAILNNNFRQAIRIYYLIVLRELSILQLIIWKKDKTNSEYLFEMKGHTYYSDFREITSHFERVWYGEFELTEVIFQSVNPKFESFMSEIRNKDSLMKQLQSAPQAN